MFFGKISRLLFAILNAVSPRNLVARFVGYVPAQAGNLELDLDAESVQGTQGSTGKSSTNSAIAVANSTASRSYVPILKLGIAAPAVEDIQIFLTEQGYSNSSIDGVYGCRTVEAVRAFQRDNNLLEDGIVGYQTWEAIIELSDWL